MITKAMDRTTIIFRVLSGTASDSENLAIAKWLDASDENQSEFRDLKLLWTNLQYTKTEKDDSFYNGLRKIKEQVYTRARKRKAAQLLVSIFFIFSLVAVFAIYFSLSPPSTHLAFDKVRLQDVITTVEDKYRIKVEAREVSALSCLFTGSFNNVDGADEIIRSIGLALNLKYEVIEKDRYRFSGNGCFNR